MDDHNLARLKLLANTWIAQEETLPRTEADIDVLVESIAFLAQGNEELLTALRRHIEEQVIITSDPASSLDNNHVPWLAAKRGTVDWRVWAVYQRHLRDQAGLPPRVVDRIDETTDTVLDRLADPGRGGPWDRRGLVVGQVQSGKTANYLGLIAKSIDVGYRVIVVLAGAGNDLRAQTQVRLEEGILGWNTSQREAGSGGGGARKVGVGLFPNQDLPVLRPLTTRDSDGDFKSSQASVSQKISTDPMILVVKKNKSVLENVIRSLTAVSADIGPDEQQIIRGVPLLLIDDEADHYSLNTARVDPETDPTTINGLVRRLLRGFQQSAYVGYTATAFANIFIAPYDESEEYGNTLFPRDFMVNVKPASNYVGARRVFGLADVGFGEPTEALPIVRHSDDTEDWLPSRHKKHFDVGGFLPDSLEEAIDAFILSIAARRARGQVDVHNSMLIHVTRFNLVQERVRELVSQHVLAIRNRLRLGDDGRTEDRLRLLWREDFLPTTEVINDRHPSDFGELAEVGWDEVVRQLRVAAESIEVRAINGMAGEVLDYVRNREHGLNVIAIGGDKLSRGLTLDGLTVSYYLRTSRAYDTLLQMGRWFGYRQNYVDLCRLYTTTQLESWYRDITVANAELLHDLDRMAADGGTPQDFGLRVRTHADGLMISSPNRMRTQTSITLSFSNRTREQVAYSRRPDHKCRAMEAAGTMMAALVPHRLDQSAQPTGRIVHEGVPGRIVSDFLRGCPANVEARLTRTDLMADYVDDRNAAGELLDWRVVVFSPTTGERTSRPLGDVEVNLSQRSSNTRETVGGEKEPTTDHDQYRVRRIFGSDDEEEGLDDRAISYATTLVQDHGLTRKDALRAQRTEGVLLVALLDPTMAQVNRHQRASDDGHDADPYVGLMVIFPPTSSPTAGREYAVNAIYRQLQLGWDDIDEDES